MKNILLPTDFSENSLNAIRYAINLYKEEECKFYVLHVYLPVIYDPQLLILEQADYMLEEVYKKNAEKKLDKVIKKVEKLAGENHSFEKLTSFNMLIPAMEEIVTEKGIYMVVMGTKGATGAREILWGSNTVHALKSLRCPLILVPQNYSFKEPKHILLPTDFHFNYPLGILKIVKDICSNYQSKIHILHVLMNNNVDYEISNSKKLLAQELKNSKHEFYTIEGRSLVKAILEFEDVFDIDLLVMVNNKHSFFRNLLFSSPVSKIGFRTENPFLVLPTGHKP